MKNSKMKLIEQFKGLRVCLFHYHQWYQLLKIIALNSTEGLFQGASEYTQTAAREFTNLVGSPILGNNRRVNRFNWSSIMEITL